MTVNCAHFWTDWFLSSKDGPFDPPISIRECEYCKARQIRSLTEDEVQLNSFYELFRKVLQGQFPLLPEPNWDQDTAFVAFYIDRLRKHLHCDQDPIECSHEGLQGEYEELRRKYADLSERYSDLLDLYIVASRS